MSFKPYVEHGWKLCRIKEGEKGPKYTGWQRRERAMQPHEAHHAPGAGLLHAYSGTCALDVDDIDLSCAYLAEQGVDLMALLAAPDAVAISSGTPNRAKLLFALPEPLPTKKIINEQKVTLFELRCADAAGTGTLQDVLPPSVHPSGRRYEWVYGDSLTGTWTELPPLPDELRAVWMKLLGPEKRSPAHDGASHTSSSLASSSNDGHAKSLAEPSVDGGNDFLPSIATRDPEILAQRIAAGKWILAHTDPSCDYNTWIETGMAFEHELGDLGYKMWDDWSRQSPKYPQDPNTMDSHWRSFGNHPNPIGFGALKQRLTATASDFDVVDLDAVDDVFDDILADRVAQFKFVHASEIVQRPPTSWLVDDLLPREDITMMYGESGAGKSFLALDLSLAIARGVEWHGMATRRGAVCWIAAEAEGSMRGRLRAYAQKHLEGLAFEDVPFYVLGAGVNLADKAQMDALAQAAEPFEPALCVVDTLAAASAGADENSFESIGVILDTCRHIHRTTGATVLLVHHAGKDVSKGARGHSSLKAAMHAELCVSRNEEGGREMRISKLRDGVDGKRWLFTLQEMLIGLDDRDKPIMSACIAELAPIDSTAAVKGDGGGHRRPKGVHEALLWDVLLDLQPLDGKPIPQEQVLQNALREGGVQPDDAPAVRRKLRNALLSLRNSRHIRMDDELIYVELSGDTTADSEDDCADLI